MRDTMHECTDKTVPERYGSADRTTHGGTMDPQQHNAGPAAGVDQGTPIEGTPATEPPTGGWSIRNIPFVVATVLAVGLALALVFVLTLGGSSNTNSAASDQVAQTYTVTVAFELSDYDTARAGCVGDGGYSDIGPGTPVRLTNESSEVLAAASLGSGSKKGGSTCRWDVTLKDVPAGERFYSVEVAGRGQITQSDSELQDSGYRFELSLG